MRAPAPSRPRPFSLAQVGIGSLLAIHEADGGEIRLADTGMNEGRGVCVACGKRWRVRLHVELLPLLEIGRGANGG